MSDIEPIELYIGPSIDLRTIFSDEFWWEPRIGFDGRIYFLRALDEEAYIELVLPEEPVQKSCDYQVVILDGEQYEGITIKDQKKAYSYVQPLPNNHFLLVSSRSIYYGNGEFDKNATVVKREGHECKVVQEFLIGDGLSHVYSTEKGSIWTGYFDEGVFGNWGWADPTVKDPRPPVGEPGVIKWSQTGEQLFVNTQAEIADCYAMNVISDSEVWFYYYDSFKLAHVKNGVFKEYDPQFESAHDFIVNEKHVLLREDHLFQLYEIQGDHLKKIAMIHLLDEDEEQIGEGNPFVEVRGDRLVFISGYDLYDIRLDEIVEMTHEMLEDE
ncbi:hypothetical protein [Alkalicoccobacillus plakortidis]|uniref:DUF4178 domain-containing protein n=1 Tax=Alkalicoccobacillus plakortidis TaxID=444060 RepID=A0ABT0XNX0_9BACI|nr:hypothetical protein [Alkalicoccobacillus plakortidis]MCM2677597.1 hypothetical protein [Alkalicoccobacillus plakortidis]